MDGSFPELWDVSQGKARADRADAVGGVGLSDADPPAARCYQTNIDITIVDANR
ncbi:hypothetical protein F4553_006370 [Allocatelliglobosispora scoriae]|uniref:Uncharacterized protein n=1 Tax=Allocatelliglobosispora scoriae TaxID=643052 RepID=A0A841BZB9_9ACTN|nr:hypothetical protein [Allocatelliglobosispora scoriae]MBB5872936.1 hypothetical protein [Allocatelliglobosispora scoriae]